jgi:hypothetical protein
MVSRLARIPGERRTRLQSILRAMKTSQESTSQRFERIQTRFVVLILAAIGVWSGQNFIAGFAAREMRAHADLWMPEEWDGARVERAFHTASQATRLDAALDRNANGFHPERRDYLTVTAPSRQAAVEGRRAMLAAIRAAFAEDGPGRLNTSNDESPPEPVPNATMHTIQQGCRGVAILLVLGAGIGLVVQSRRARLPLAAVVAVLVMTLAVFTARDRPVRTGAHTLTWLDALWAGVLVVLGIMAVIHSRRRGS